MSEGLFSDHIGMINELFNERSEVPSREQQLEAQIADLRKKLRDVENERDVRGDILERLVGIRQELIDTESNSWIDSIGKIRGLINAGRGFQDQLEKAHRDIEILKADKASLNQAFDETLNMIWEVVRPDGGSWDYPAQVVRYVQDVVGSNNVMKPVTEDKPRDPWANNPKARPMPHPGTLNEF